MTRTRAAAALTAAALILAGCSTTPSRSEIAAAGRAAVESMRPDIARSTYNTPTTTAPPTSQLVLPDAPVNLGESVSVDLTPWGNGAFRATVFEVKVAPRQQYSMVAEGQQTVGVNVEMCVTAPAAGGGDSTVQANQRWALGDTRNGRYEPATSSMSDDDTLTPAYPYYAQPVALGECIRGWVPFVTAAGAPINTVRYAVGGTSNTVRWAVPA